MAGRCPRTVMTTSPHTAPAVCARCVPNSTCTLSRVLSHFASAGRSLCMEGLCTEVQARHRGGSLRHPVHTTAAFSETPDKEHRTLYNMARRYPQDAIQLCRIFSYSTTKRSSAPRRRRNSARTRRVRRSPYRAHRAQRCRRACAVQHTR